MIPEDINLFEVNGDKYPLLDKIYQQGHIVKTTLEAGDCLYIPSFYWSQSRTHAEESTIIGFTYQASSKLSEIFFEAINDGVLEKIKAAFPTVDRSDSLES